MSAMSTSSQSTNEKETESSSPLSSSTESKSNILSSRLKVAVHVEAEIKRSCRSKAADVSALVKERLSTQYTIFQNGWIPIPDDLLDIVESIFVTDLPLGQKVSFWQADIIVHAFRMLDEEPEAEFLEGEGADLPLGEQIELPNRLLAGLWDSIVVEDSIKSMLLNYCCTSLLFAGNNVNANLISWNKMILLHGPPGMPNLYVFHFGAADQAPIVVLDRNWENVSLQSIGPENLHTKCSNVQKWITLRSELSFSVFEMVFRIWEIGYEIVSAY